MFENFRKIHFTGIGGIGMSGIAEVLLNLGYEITGSDLKESENTKRLSALGAKITIGHKAENVDHAHVVVISSAVSAYNPEVEAARLRLIPVIPRAEMLAELGRLKYSLLVAGAHGKTTTTSFVSTILSDAGFDPTVVIGGKLKAFGSNARLGSGEFFVAEADESDGSFLKLTPTIAVVTNVDKEHMEYFKTMDALKEAFLSFMNKVPFYGVTIACIDNPNVRELAPKVHRRLLTYGFSRDARLRAENLSASGMSMSFDASLDGRKLGRFTLAMPGEHNVLNALGAIGAALELRIPTAKIKASLKRFEGIGRRLELKGSEKGVKVYDDYGHHPAEASATIKSLRNAYPKSKILVVFQPHRYTRTRDLMDEFSGSFNLADRLYLMDIYPAGESPIEDVTSGRLLEKISKVHKSASHISDREELVRAVSEAAKKGDVVLTLGAGDVTKLGPDILRTIKGYKER